MANNNFRTESKKFFNAQTGKNNRAWADAAGAYYRQVGSTSKKNFVDAMAAYYAKVNAGTISAPVSPTATQKLVSNGDGVPVVNSSATALGTGIAVIAAGTLSYVQMPAGFAGVANAGSVTVPITFVTARTAGQQATVAATFTVAGGVITAISIA
jgi:hypothetical protein